MSRRALITGVAGQDGSYLSELLLDKGYAVFGISGPAPLDLLSDVKARGGDRFRLIPSDLTDADSLVSAVEEARPDEIYNLAAVSGVGDSWGQVLSSTDVNAFGVLRLLEAARRVCPSARILETASAEVFGRSIRVPQDEGGALDPGSPYGAAKAYALMIGRVYREAYGVFCANALLFNHESPRRETTVVTRKITDAAARISLGLADSVALGNLDARRDWGFAGDYVKAMWAMLQQEKPDDFVIATGVAHSVREFCEAAFAHVGLGYRDHVTVDERFMRPADVEIMVGDASKARSALGWEPSVDFAGLVGMMVDADLERLRGARA
ncbi:MAG: GDP-mannose 4,6-dehydratase [Coriobacteriia bacterium]|nr:GDP-mannose 4,6-dehydratase [Coriobacteriia bacterium]